MHISPEQWKPVKVQSLEPAAETVARGHTSTLVYAGPGAGKTELLAQRACFLLQTGTCADPRRILAISFKRDAAKNLRDRVMLRCGIELATRFDSYTFDSFSKGLVDRFRASLPTWCLPQPDYRVLDKLNASSAFQLVRTIPSNILKFSEEQVQGLDPKRLWKALTGRVIPIDGKWVNRSPEEMAASALWTFLVTSGGTSALGFPMIGRMADLLLRTNPLVVDSLRKAYQFVFLDEFQDTTDIQYALVRTAFHGSQAVMTAVGDDKQRIMGWAGALKGVFKTFAEEFSATPVPLLRNYRSAENLVKIQAVIAKAINPDAHTTVHMDAGADGDGECRVFVFKDEDSEASYVSAMIKQWISDGRKPREICVLSKLKNPAYTETLRDALASHPVVRSRIEDEIQDTLAEPLTECVLDLVKLATRERAPEAWSRTVSLLLELSGDRTDESARQAVDRLLHFIERLKTEIASASSTTAEIEHIAEMIMTFIGEAEFKAANPQYLRGEWYALLTERLIAALVDARNGRNWVDAVDEVEGLNSVPVMTTHKSKGLEYHTVVFVGLEDSAFFGLKSGEPDDVVADMCVFFVALSRAAKRVVFTFSRERSTGRNGSKMSQQATNVNRVYELLSKAGVKIEKIS